MSEPITEYHGWSAWELCECDTVAACSLEEAWAWYLKQNGLGAEYRTECEEDGYAQKPVNLSTEIWVDEYRDKKLPMLDSLKDHIGRGTAEPFVICSTEF